MADKVDRAHAVYPDKGKGILVEDPLTADNFPPLVQSPGESPSPHGLPQATSPTPQWRLLFQQAHRIDERLSFHEPKVENGVCIVEPPDEVFEVGVKSWANTLVGYFVGKRIPFKVVKEQLEKKWGKWGSVKVITGANGNFLFKFDNSASCDLVLSNGPWEVWGAYLALRRWEEGMSLSKDSFSSIPVWVKLANVPPELWTRPGLSYVASALGVPLCMDAATSAGNRLNFARVCVEMKASSSFPNSFKVRRRSGILAEVMVQYVWKPSVCSACRVFDHSSKQCQLVEDKTLPAQVYGEEIQNLSQKEPVTREGSDMDNAMVQDESNTHVVEVPQPNVPAPPHEVTTPTDVLADTVPIREEVKDPITPHKEPALRPTSLSHNPPAADFRYVEGSGKKKKKKRDASRKGLTPSR
ncbi:DUF4283 domain-containing protein [Cephalotus follicularis]|uniref:DUF4283 domain-containing protein n=1 Tax=Cephalotus follicularis TaxID=3775 RepID=A0A1Q3DKJ1_CEPFO|nr:DUF4283 domain-containing protein [Cephalotus follicularis]